MPSRIPSVRRPRPSGSNEDMSLEDFEAVADHTLRALPDGFGRHIADVVIRIADFPDPETLEKMDIGSPYGLLGLYHGVALGNKSVSDIARPVDMIFLYREPILRYWRETGEDLTAVIRHVLIHEIGHHFGLSDDEMEAIETADTPGADQE